MLDRGFSEVDLRVTMERATGLYENAEPGRWVVETRHVPETWQVILEPDSNDRLLVIITAFPVDKA